jgi:hypothetical protein
MTNRIMYAIAWACQHRSNIVIPCPVPGPFAAAKASSPMKKSRSSVPRFIDRCPPGPAPPVRYEGLLATAGRPDPEPPLPAAGPLVAIAVGKTKEGESLPAKPARHWLTSPDQKWLLTTYQASRNPYRWRQGISIFCSTQPRQFFELREGSWWVGNVLVHDNGGSLGSHIEEELAPCTPRALELLCDGFTQ